MAARIFSGRFQPLHRGHIKFLEAIKQKHPDDILIICIIRNTAFPPKSENATGFGIESKEKHQPINNPLPNWNRYYLLSLEVKTNKLLAKNTEIIFRDRSDINWAESVSDLPEERVFVFPKYSKEAFDTEKQKYYQMQHESIEFLDFYDQNEMFSGAEIRNRIRIDREQTDLSFLPESCQEYFRTDCLKYFL